MRACTIRPAAEVEIDDQAAYLAEHASELIALRFLAAVDETLARLRETPGIGSVWGSEHARLQGVHRCKVAGFPNHLLFYRYDENTVEVLHVYHGKQDIDGRLGDDYVDSER